MELRRIQYKGIYGHLSGTLDFQQGENFLVGINGCGKTTILNLIRWILGPSLPDLCTLDHDRIVLNLKHEKYLYSIQSKLYKTKHELKVVTKDTSRDFHPIVTTLHVHPNTMKSSAYLREVRDAYQRLSPEPKEVTTWSFLLEELPSPVFVGLGRHIEDTAFYPSRRTLRGRGRSSESRPATSTATELMRDAFNSARRQLVEINDDLNRKVLELSFSGVIRPTNRLKTGTAEGMREKIGQLKEKFTKAADEGEYSKALSSAEVRSAIVKYLADLEGLLSRGGTDDEVWVALNQHNFDRAAKMFDLFEKHEDRAHGVQKEMETFISAVNSFLTDSGKQIHFDADTGNPSFTCGSAEGSMSLAELSSGEAQVVILLSYFAFLAKTGVPIIIDEPELSLHVEWQKHFVGAVKRVMPSECQTVMATHSPEICGAEAVNVQAISVRSLK